MIVKIMTNQMRQTPPEAEENENDIEGNENEEAGGE